MNVILSANKNTALKFSRRSKDYRIGIFIFNYVRFIKLSYKIKNIFLNFTN